MGDKFDSFDESPLGVFIESPLGVRGVPRQDIILYFQGTSQTYLNIGGQALWDAALLKWQAAIDDFGKPLGVEFSGDIGHPIFGSREITDYMAPDQTPPDHVNMEILPRNPNGPAMEDYEQVYFRAIGGENAADAKTALVHWTIFYNSPVTYTHLKNFLEGRGVTITADFTGAGDWLDDLATSYRNVMENL